MPANLKRRFVTALLCLLIWGPMAAPRAADVPLPRMLAKSSEQRPVTPRQRPSISRLEILQAIQSALGRAGASGGQALQPEDLKIQSVLPTLKTDMGLQVKKITYNPLRRETVFEIRATREPQYLPFEVTTRRDPPSLGLTSCPGWTGEKTGLESQTARQTAGQGATGIAAKPPILAKPGRPAILIMLGENVRITTTVVPLQPGSKGQRILVRDVTSARVTRAEVVGEGLLRASL